MLDTYTQEKGQALVLITLAMVVLLGFTALAIDGGMVYSDRRHAQNAADASSLAGGSAAALQLENDHITYGTWGCNKGDILDAMDAGEGAAIDRAGDNGFSIDANITDYHGVMTDCGSEPYGPWEDKFIDIHTHISTTTPTSFAHFVYGGKLMSRVHSVTRIRPRMAFGFGASILALNDDPNCDGNQNGVVFDGNNEVQVEGGGITSNGCLKGSGSTLDVEVVGGDIIHVGEIETQHVDTFSPNPESGNGVKLPDFAVAYPKPDCSEVDDFDHPSTEFRNNAGGTYLDPEFIPMGNYSAIKMNGTVVLEGGGLYCLYGDFDAGNNDLTIKTMTTESGKKYMGVTIYMVSGSFIVNGNADTVILTAPPDDPDPSPAIPGMLIYLAEGNDGLVKLRGSSNSIFVGTIYAPDGDIDIAGNPDMPAGQNATFNTQLVAYNVKIGGNAFVDVNFDEDTSYLMPTNLELHR